MNYYSSCAFWITPEDLYIQNDFELVYKPVYPYVTFEELEVANDRT